MSSKPRIVITGLGLTAPNGNSLSEFRANLLAGKARIAVIDVRHMGKHPAGVCDFDTTKWQKRKEIRNGTLQGAYLIVAARALGLDCGAMSGFDNAKVDAAFFPDGRFKTNFLCNIGYGDETKIFARSPRMDFEDACSFA